MQLTVCSPFDGQVVAELPFDRGETLDLKLERAASAHAQWRRSSLPDRIAVIDRALSYFRENREEIARDVTRQMGKPLEQSRGELATFFDRAEELRSIAPECLKAEVLPPRPGFHRRIEHAPLGVVFNISAWNYPLIISVNVVVPALLAGNSVLLKHSAKTPLIGVHFERAFRSAAPEGLLTNLILTHEETARVIGDPRVDHVAFTGSVEGGREVQRAAAGRFIDVGLELGGKDPAYVAEDADLDGAIENVVDGACYNAGQSCCAVERVYVHESRHDAFLKGAQKALESYVLGDPLSSETTMGPLISASALALVERQVEDAVSRGARLLTGGKRPLKMTGHFFAPTLLADVPDDAEVLRDETFGPIVAVQRVSGDDEALAKMNDTRFGLTASVWTRDRERAERFARDLEAGTVFQNRCDYLDPALPWTGWRDSGRGSTLSRYGFCHLTKRKSVHFRD